MRYTCYGLQIESEIGLPELFPSAAISSPADIRIVLGSVSRDGLVDGLQLGPFLWTNTQTLWLEVPGVARFLAQDGNTIRIDPASGIDEDSIRVFLLGSAFGAILFQRGLLVLHGNAIQIGEQCMICVGMSGAGKSTLAAAFAQRGYPILADDVVPIDNGNRALPGFPRSKLWQDAADRLAIDTSALRRIRPELAKFNYPVFDRYADRALPVRWIYILDIHPSPQIVLEPIRGLHRFLPLRNNTYRKRYLQGTALSTEHLKQCSRLSNSIHLAKVSRPEAGFELDHLVDRLLADIADHP